MLDRLYQNIGDKIKGLAKASFVVESIAAVIAGLVLAFEEEACILISIFGPVVAFVSSWILYAFGELVEDVHAMRNKEISVADVPQKNHILETVAAHTADIVQKYNNQKEASMQESVSVKTEETDSKANKTVCVVGHDIAEGQYRVSAKNSQGGMIYIYSTDNTLLDKRYIKKNERVKLKSGTVVKLYDCEIYFE